MGLCAGRMLEDAAERRRSAGSFSTSGTEATDDGDSCRPVNTVPTRHVRMIVLGTLTMIWATCMAVLSAVLLAVPLNSNGQYKATNDGVSPLPGDPLDELVDWGLPAWPFFSISLGLHVAQILAGWMLVNGAMTRTSAKVVAWLLTTFATAVLYLGGTFILGSSKYGAICMGIFAAFVVLAVPCCADVTCFFFALRREERRRRRAREGGYATLETDPDPEGGRLDPADGFGDLENDCVPPTPHSVRISGVGGAGPLLKAPPSYEEATGLGFSSVESSYYTPQSPHLTRTAMQYQTDSTDQDDYKTVAESSSTQSSQSPTEKRKSDPQTAAETSKQPLLQQPVDASRSTPPALLRREQKEQEQTPKQQLKQLPHREPQEQQTPQGQEQIRPLPDPSPNSNL